MLDLRLVGEEACPHHSPYWKIERLAARLRGYGWRIHWPVLKVSLTTPCRRHWYCVDALDETWYSRTLIGIVVLTGNDSKENQILMLLRRRVYGSVEVAAEQLRFCDCVEGSVMYASRSRKLLLCE